MIICNLKAILYSTKIIGIVFLIFLNFHLFAQDSLVEKPLPAEFKELLKYNTPIEYKFDSITVFAICTGFISTKKHFPEPVFVWLIKTPIGNYLIDGGLSPRINTENYFKGFSKTFFSNQFEFYIYRSNDLLAQLKKIDVSIDLNSIILTHGHFDHIGYLPLLKKTPIILSSTEKKQIETLGQMGGYEKGTQEMIDFKRCQAIELMEMEQKPINRYISVIRTGNHTKGHMMVLVSTLKSKLLFTGDINLNKLPPESEIYKIINTKYKISSLQLFFNHDQKLK